MPLIQGNNRIVNLFKNNERIGNAYLGNTQVLPSLPQGAYPTWSPADLPGIVYWFKSDAGLSLSGAVVNGWRDQISGSATYASGWGSLVGPTYVSTDASVNGYPVIQFNSGSTTNQALYFNVNSSPWITYSDFTVMMIYAPFTQTNADAVVGGVVGPDPGAGGDLQLALMNRSTIGVYEYSLFYFDVGTAGTYAQSGVGTTTNTWALHASSYNWISPSTNAEVYQWVNGTPVTGLSGLDANVAKDNLTFSVGAYTSAGANFWKGKVLEIMYLNTVPSSTEFNSLSWYCKTKYGIL
jgi:hypothetical protein